MASSYFNLVFLFSALIISIFILFQETTQVGAGVISKNSTKTRNSRQFGCGWGAQPSMGWGPNQMVRTDDPDPETRDYFNFGTSGFTAPPIHTVKGNFGCHRADSIFTFCWSWCTVKNSKRIGWCHTHTAKNKKEPAKCESYSFLYTENIGKDVTDGVCGENFQCYSKCFDNGAAILHKNGR